MSVCIAFIATLLTLNVAQAGTNRDKRIRTIKRLEQSIRNNVRYKTLGGVFLKGSYRTRSGNERQFVQTRVKLDRWGIIAVQEKQLRGDWDTTASFNAKSGLSKSDRGRLSAIINKKFTGAPLTPRRVKKLERRAIQLVKNGRYGEASRTAATVKAAVVVSQIEAAISGIKLVRAGNLDPNSQTAHESFVWGRQHGLVSPAELKAIIATYQKAHPGWSPVGLSGLTSEHKKTKPEWLQKFLQKKGR